MRHRRFLTILLFLIAAPLLAGGYTIYLKDGSRLVAKNKYRIENGRAIITLPNGTQTFVAASQIDVRRTDEANKDGYGGAVVLPGTPQDVGAAPAEPPKDKTLADLIASRTAAPRELPGSRRDKAEPAPGRLGKTKAGYLDFATVARKPLAHPDLTAELQQFFHSQGTDEVEMYQGTRADQPLLEITTNSEASVFKALNTAANALLRIRDLHPDQVSAFELLLTTPGRERAGQFVLTPEMAADLVSRKVEVGTFFVRHVQF
jgi:hypothetical protein